MVGDIIFIEGVRVGVAEGVAKRADSVAVGSARVLDEGVGVSLGAGNRRESSCLGPLSPVPVQ